MVSKFLLLILKVALGVIVFLSWAWGIMALYIAWQGSHWMQIVMASTFGLLLPLAFLLTGSPFRGAVLYFCVFVLLLFWWGSLSPTNDKEWAQEVAQISHGEIEGEYLTMHNVRNFDYKNESIYLQRWEDRQYNLNNLKGVDIFLSYWASDDIAHTILSWDFGADGHLAISIETRKDKTQQYSAVKGFFKQFEIVYIAADERDIIRLRTNFRKERVYLYRLQAPREQILALLKDYLAEMNSLVAKPEFYNALAHNCTTTIQLHANTTRPDGPPPLDWRLIASGHVDELLYDRGVISTNLPFDELRKASRVDLKMQQEDSGNISTIMRNYIPTNPENK